MRKPSIENEILQLHGKREKQKGGLLGQLPTTVINPLISEIFGKGITTKKGEEEEEEKGKYGEEDNGKHGGWKNIS